MPVQRQLESPTSTSSTTLADQQLQQLGQLLDLLSNFSLSMQTTSTSSSGSGSITPQDDGYSFKFDDGPVAPSSGPSRPSRNHRGRQAETQHRNNYTHESSEMVSEDHFAANNTGGVGTRTKPYHRRGRSRRAWELKKRRVKSAIPTLAPAPAPAPAPPVAAQPVSSTPTAEITQWTVEEDDDDFDKMSIGSD